ncbi:MAG: Riboflavin synthase [Fimbriimonadales bacterium]|nr:MAG: riboflavin synthase [Armatimonadota bacterium]MBV6503385.1 Riboflavin synthase [Fimbriimonadales bacterium]MCE7900383.1 riboflavin synthase [Armatimonadetes bacterium ATM1]MDL1928274.1 riboflavin synthase [Fimbriimonadia bacterium ATM]MBC6969173.1 riboflavin synthase [Armatimonadota bacterium]
MFTGIVQAVGRTLSVGHRLEVAAALPRVPSVGDSVAINGCCLTHIGGDALTFELSDETLARTTFGRLSQNTAVNVELALRVGDPMGGHFVSGHVDCVGALLRRESGAAGERFTFRAPDEFAKYLVDKGSITVDGVSLTVVEPNANDFHVWLIPHTLESTTLGQMREGSEVNLEFDLLARYVERILIYRP